MPHPARFVLHTLVVARSRAAALQTKSDKDLRQAAGLVVVLGRDRPGDLELAWEALVARGTSWRRAVEQGMRALRRRHPDAHAALAGITGT